MKRLITKRRKRKTAIQIDDTAMTVLHAAAQAAAPKETGGILLGWWDEDCIVISEAVEVIDPAATSHSWSRREADAQRALEAAIAASTNPVLGYVGDWHCHPAPVGASPQDLAALARSSRQYEHPLALIVRLSDARLMVHAAARGRELNVEIRY